MALSHNDIAILGAGPAGVSAALFLASKRIPCTILDKSTFPRDKVCGDAISGKVISLLKQLDPNILMEFSSYEQASNCWGIKFIAPDGSQADIPFKKEFSTHSDVLPSGFVIKRYDFDHYLYQKCTNNPFINIRTGTAYTQSHKTKNGFSIRLDDGSHLESKLVLCADGAYSKFAKDHGHMKMEPEHYCGSVRAYFKNVNNFGKGNFLELYFLKDILPGYFWIFPLPNGEANVGLGLRSDYIRRNKINLKTLMQEIITSDKYLSKRMQGAEMIGKIEGFGIPLGSKRRAVSGDHFMLLGDAASIVDPFTGEGISNAMLSGKIAAEVVAYALKNDSFTATNLSMYDQKLYGKIGEELKLSRWLQNLSRYPWLMNFVISKAQKNQEFRETITCMFDNVDLRSKFKDPRFYMRIFFQNT